MKPHASVWLSFYVFLCCMYGVWVVWCEVNKLLAAAKWVGKDRSRLGVGVCVPVPSE